MSYLDSLFLSSFRNVSFYWDLESLESGIKHVIHEYPDSDRQFVEQLGKIPPTFTFNAFLFEPDLKTKRIALENVLSLAGIGKLIHPVYGEIDVVPLEFSASSSQTEVGRAGYNLKFARTEAATPEPIEYTQTAVKRAALQTRGDIDANLVENWEIPVDAYQKQQAAGKLVGLWNQLKSGINSVVSPIEAAASEFNKTVRALTFAPYALLQDAAKLKDSFRLIFDSALAVVSTPQSLKNVWDSLLEGDFLPPEVLKSQFASNNYRSQINLDEHFKLHCLTNAYEAAAFSDFLTDEDLQNTKDFLNENYTKALLDIVFVLKTYNVESIIEGNTVLQASFNNLRSLARTIFEQKETNLYQILEIEAPQRTSLALIVYNYYNNLDLLDKIDELNPEINPANFTGKIKVLSR